MNRSYLVDYYDNGLNIIIFSNDWIRFVKGSIWKLNVELEPICKTYHLTRELIVLYFINYYSGKPFSITFRLLNLICKIMNLE